MRYKKRIIRDPRPFRSGLIGLDRALYVSRNGTVYVDVGYRNFKRIGKLSSSDLELIKKTYGTSKGAMVRKAIANKIWKKIKPL